MFFILIIVIGLVAWALHLMQEAVQHKEFSLMLAGFLVSVAAAAMMAVYFLMGHYVGYMSEMAQRAYLSSDLTESIGWSDASSDWVEEWMRDVQVEVDQSYTLQAASMFNPHFAPLIQP